MSGSQITLDAPDLNVRRIMQKRADGQRLTDAEYRRLGTRQSVEAETMRTGGSIKGGGITPRRLSPYEQGQADRQADDGYAAGFKGRAPAARASQPGEAPDASAPSASPVRRAAGPIDVRSYRGSMFSKPGSYTAPGPLENAPGRSFGGDARTDIDAQGRPVKPTAPVPLGTDDSIPETDDAPSASPLRKSRRPLY